jgi:hypothetical protein
MTLSRMLAVSDSPSGHWHHNDRLCIKQQLAILYTAVVPAAGDAAALQPQMQPAAAGGERGPLLPAAAVAAAATAAAAVGAAAAQTCLPDCQREHTVVAQQHCLAAIVMTGSACS